MKLCFEQSLPIPRERLFAFHCDPANLAELLTGWRGFELVAHDGNIRPGSRVRVRQEVGWLAHEMTFEHFVLEPPVRFGERQVSGPFARFEHVHEFTEVGGGTAIVDRVDFELSWRRGGPLADRLVAARVLERFFRFRKAAYRRLAEAGRFR